jgi:excisionase family DNA binding protein
MKEQIHFSITLEELEVLVRRSVRVELQSQPQAPTSTTDPEYITRKQVRELLGVSYTTLGNWRKAGTLPACKIGNQVRYVKADVIAHIEHQK